MLKVSEEDAVEEHGMWRNDSAVIHLRRDKLPVSLGKLAYYGPIIVCCPRPLVLFRVLPHRGAVAMLTNCQQPPQISVWHQCRRTSRWCGTLLVGNYLHTKGLKKKRSDFFRFLLGGQYKETCNFSWKTFFQVTNASYSSNKRRKNVTKRLVNGTVGTNVRMFGKDLLFKY